MIAVVLVVSFALFLASRATRGLPLAPNTNSSHERPSSLSDALQNVAPNFTAPLLDQYSPFVLGPATKSFRDNLRDDLAYITSWTSAGWST